MKLRLLDNCIILSSCIVLESNQWNYVFWTTVLFSHHVFHHFLWRWISNFNEASSFYIQSLNYFVLRVMIMSFLASGTIQWSSFNVLSLFTGKYIACNT